MVQTMRPRIFLKPLFSLLFLLLFSPIAVCTTAAHADQNAEGVFTTLWGDSFTDSIPQKNRYFLTDGSGATAELLIDQEIAAESGGLLHLNGRMVRVFYTDVSHQRHKKYDQSPALSVNHIDRIHEKAGRQETYPLAIGSQPWVTIMCKFSDVPGEPKTLSYFQNMYSSAYPGMDHYWREASYQRVNISGSEAHGWYTLPQPRSYYVYDSNGDSSDDLDFTRITNDCTAVADADIYFPDFVGINLMFNDELDGFAWGGSRYLSLDGTSKLFRVTWEPPWGYSSITVIAHEMGHGFGMPHSSGNYGATYDNAWDVMSDSWINCSAATHPTYGCLGQHTIGYHRDLVGWLESGEKFRYSGTAPKTITLERITQPVSNNYLLAIIPVDNSPTHFYTVEVRKLVGYDTKLVAEAVIIHEVNTARSRPAYVVDIDNNGQTADAGAMWTVGETFVDSANNICIQILSNSNTGYTVKIGCGSSTTAPSLAPIYQLLR